MQSSATAFDSPKTKSAARGLPDGGAICALPPDAGDYMAPAELQAWVKSKNAVPTATLMDSDAKLGRGYGARTTPRMYAIDPQGELICAGAIDSRPTANPIEIKLATNYVAQALGEAMAGSRQPSAAPPRSLVRSPS